MCEDTGTIDRVKAAYLQGPLRAGRVRLVSAALEVGGGGDWVMIGRETRSRVSVIGYILFQQYVLLCGRCFCCMFVYKLLFKEILEKMNEIR